MDVEEIRRLARDVSRHTTLFNATATQSFSSAQAPVDRVDYGDRGRSSRYDGDAVDESGGGTGGGRGGGGRERSQERAYRQEENDVAVYYQPEPSSARRAGERRGGGFPPTYPRGTTPLPRADHVTTPRTPLEGKRLPNTRPTAFRPPPRPAYSHGNTPREPPRRESPPIMSLPSFYSEDFGAEGVPHHYQTENHYWDPGRRSRERRSSSSSRNYYNTVGGSYEQFGSYHQFGRYASPHSVPRRRARSQSSNTPRSGSVYGRMQYTKRKKLCRPSNSCYTFSSVCECACAATSIRVLIPAS